MKSRLVSLFVGLLMAAAAVFGTVLAPEAAQAASVKRVTFASAGFHESNRSWTVSRPDHLQFEPFWETLIGLDPKTSDPIPALATKWEHSPDYKEWTFHLRKGVQFHYGYGEFTSADVVHSHSLVVRKDSTSTLRPFWATVEEVKPVDKHTVVFRFKNPVLPSSMVFGASRSGDLRMASKAQWDKEGVEGYDKRPAGTGPFMYARAADRPQHRVQAQRQALVRQQGGIRGARVPHRPRRGDASRPAALRRRPHRRPAARAAQGRDRQGVEALLVLAAGGLGIALLRRDVLPSRGTRSSRRKSRGPTRRCARP